MIDDERLDRIIRRIVEVAQPEKIILFGFAARGALGPNSDLDLLVIKSCPRRSTVAMQIYSKLAGMGCALDIIVVTPEDVERHGYSPDLVTEPALREVGSLCSASVPLPTIRRSLKRCNTEAKVDTVVATLPGIILRPRSISPIT